jgi:hypothetical protein
MALIGMAECGGRAAGTPGRVDVAAILMTVLQ